MRFKEAANVYFAAGSIAHPTIFQLFTSICLPIFILIALGWILDRRFDLDLKTLVKLNIYLFVPAFIFVMVMDSSLAGAEAFKVVSFTLLVIGAMGALSWAYARISKLPSKARRSLQLSTMFYNSGNYGLPLMVLAYPGLGPTLQVFVLMTMNISTFSIGVFLASSSDHPTLSWRRLLPMLRQPSIHAILIALILRGLDFDTAIKNSFVWPPLFYLKDALIGFALITLGVQLAKTRPPAIRGPLGWALTQRLIGGPCIAAALFPLFRFPIEAFPILVLSAATPTAINTALLAHEFDADPAFATAVVFYSTLISLITITCILFLLNRLGF